RVVGAEELAGGSTRGTDRTIADIHAGIVVRQLRHRELGPVSILGRRGRGEDPGEGRAAVGRAPYALLERGSIHDRRVARVELDMIHTAGREVSVPGEA